jgi:hypothetical protein
MWRVAAEETPSSGALIIVELHQDGGKRRINTVAFLGARRFTVR